MRERFPDAVLAAMGICSGGFFALRAVAASRCLDAVFAVNAPMYWDGTPIPEVRHVDHVVHSIAMGSALGSGTKWRKLLAGGYSARVVRSAAVGFAIRVKESIPFIPQAAVFNNGLPRLKLPETFPRHTRIELIFSRGDPSYQHLIHHRLATLRRMGERQALRIHVFDTADHIFKSRAMRQELEERVLGLLGLRASQSVDS